MNDFELIESEEEYKQFEKKHMNVDEVFNKIKKYVEL